MAEDKELTIRISADNQSGKAFDEVDDSVKKVGDQLEDTDKKMKKLGDAFKTVAKIGAVGFGAIVGAVGLSVKAYAESEEQLARVDGIMDNLSEKTMKQFTGGTEQAKQIAREFGDELQALGGIGGETASEGFAKLLQITEDSSVAMDAATAAADLATFKQIDYSTAVDIVAKALNGNTGALVKYGIELKEGATAQDVLNALTEKAGGLYEKSGQTLAGQTKIMQESFGDLQESIGQAFAPAIIKVMEVLKPMIDSFAKWAADNPKLVATIAVVVGAIFGILAVIGTLGIVIPAITAGFAALGTVLAFLAANPVVLIIAAIAALVAAGIYLYNNWDEVKMKLRVLWEGIKIIFTDTVNAIKAKLDEWWGSMKEAWNNGIAILKNAWDAFWEGIKKAAKMAVDEIIKQITSITNIKLPGISIPMNVTRTVTDIVSGDGGKSSDVAKTRKASGGFVGGKGFTDRISTLLSPGELVLNRAQQQNLADSLATPTININMGGVTVAGEADEDRLTKKIADAVFSQLKLAQQGVKI